MCTTDAFPKYLLTVGEVRQFVPLNRAGQLMNYGYTRVELHQDVLESDFRVRPITETERAEIQRIADAADASK